jgi:hypothetical protein
LLKISGQLSCSATTPDSEDLRFEYWQDNQLYVPSWLSVRDPSFHTSFLTTLYKISFIAFHDNIQRDVCVTVHHQYNDVSNQRDATIFFRLLTFFKSGLHVSGDKIRSSSGALFDCIYSYWYNAPTALPTGATVEMVPSQPWHWSAAVSVHCTKSCIYSQKVLLRIGEFVARNM